MSLQPPSQTAFLTARQQKAGNIGKPAGEYPNSSRELANLLKEYPNSFNELGSLLLEIHKSLADLPISSEEIPISLEEVGISSSPTTQEALTFNTATRRFSRVLSGEWIPTGALWGEKEGESETFANFGSVVSTLFPQNSLN